MPTQPSSLTPIMTNPPRTPLVPVKKTFTSLLGVSSQLLRSENPKNRGIRIENRMSNDIYISITGNPATTTNIRIKANDDMDWPVGLVQAIYIIAPGLAAGGTVIIHEFE